jgi:hypothetical protein
LGARNKSQVNFTQFSNAFLPITVAALEKLTYSNEVKSVWLEPSAALVAAKA